MSGLHTLRTVTAATAAWLTATTLAFALFAAPVLAQKQGGVLNITNLTGPVGFDMHSPKKASSRTQEYMSFTHNRLFMYAEDESKGLAIVPDLVKTMERPNPTTYIFELHHGVRFHNRPPLDGRELTAKDVKWTFDRVMAQSPEKRLFPTLEKVTVLDKYKVRFDLKSPYAPFRANLAATTMVVYPEEAGKPCKSCAGGRDFTSPETDIGTGPFVLEEYKEGQRLVYKRHPDYFRKPRPYLDGVNVYIIKDPASQIAAYRTGKVDLLGNWMRIDHIHAEDAQKFPNTQVALFAVYATAENIVGRMDEKPWNDVRVRRAISMAINRDAWSKGLFPMGATKLAGPVPSASAYFIAEEKLPEDVHRYYRHDPEAARKLLAEAGYPNGFETKLYTTTGYGQPYNTRTALIKDQLSRIGINATIVSQEYPQWIKGTYKGNFHGLVHIPRWRLGDEDEWLGAYTPGNTRNQMHLDDPTITGLVKASREATSDEARARAIGDFLLRFHDQMLRVFLPIEHTVEIYSTALKGYSPKVQGYDHGKRLEAVWLER